MDRCTPAVTCLALSLILATLQARAAAENEPDLAKRHVFPDIEAKRSLEQILKREDGPKQVALQAVLNP